MEKLDFIPNDLVSLKDYERYAKQIMDLNSLAYINSGAADEVTFRKNEEAFQEIYLETNSLEELKNLDIKIELFKEIYDNPIFLAPVAYQKLVDINGEISTVQASNVMNCCMCVSSFSSCSLEEISKNATSPLWFQLYIQPDMNINLELIKKAEKLGFKALVITIDAPINGIRNVEQRYGFSLPKEISAVNIKNPFQLLNDYENISDIAKKFPTWKEIEFIKNNSSLPVVLKGINSVSYAKKSLELGIDGIIVSNHGGRTLDSLAPSIKVLPKIAKEINKKIPIIFDGGIKRGTDIIKAIALGADAVMIGRPIMYGLATAGALGVAHTLKILKEELQISMIFTGCENIEKIKEIKLSNLQY
ncbi:alpha-hydroxy acid oxidase [Arcobacter cloacae]|uniref:Alpha-hydroxy-acid oxidizing enzyme n=1 Tax=Arcobacter cloacae TaxID=1054034 RepID=A0A4Q0ZC30_9BACT|nr:alpha-hydroxy acid oxidase [Arcobacter cloacae]RXJ83779.1 alpha-hydroxy-acid oxidizing enzyme [Arcobacter cloacae]